MPETTTIARRFECLKWALDERLRRLVAAAEAKDLGYGGVSLVARATHVSRRAITAGLEELKAQVPASPAQRVRKSGGGRKRAITKDATILRNLEALIEPTTRGDPQSPLRWTCKSTRRLALELTKMGHKASHWLVADLLRELNYSLQGNRKTKEGESHEDRNAQFEHISRQVTEQLKAGNPVISVDTKKKELVGDFKNGGKELRPQGQPEEVRVHDFLVPELGRANPYGVYDLAHNVGWVSVGVDHDTSAFAVATIRRWWQLMGQPRYPKAQHLLITADGGGSNGSRVRLWKLELQKLADELGFPISVCHLPPGTSKWNKIEHRLFSFISQNWRGKPLISHEVIVNLIEGTTTRTGLKIKSEIDRGRYAIGQKVTDKEVAAVNLKRDEFHGEWNYTIHPSSSPDL